MKFSKQSHLILIVTLCGALGIMAGVSLGRSTPSAPENMAQDPAGLDRRISQLEQRFYQMESSINRLQQYVSMQRTPVTQPGVSDRDFNLVRDEVKRLSLRVNEVECALVKLDERTVPASRKRNLPKSTDPCRLDPDSSLRLTVRP